MTVVIQKGMDDSDAHFERMFKELTTHKSGTAHTLRDYELTASAESEKAEQDRKETSSTVLAELALMNKILVLLVQQQKLITSRLRMKLLRLSELQVIPSV